KRASGLDPAAEPARGRDDDAGLRVEIPRAVELALVLPAADDRVELDAGRAERRQLPRCGNEDAAETGVVQGFRVAAREVAGVEPRELVPGQTTVAATGSQLLPENHDRSLPSGIHERERATGRPGVGDGAHLHSTPRELGSR